MPRQASMRDVIYESLCKFGIHLDEANVLVPGRPIEEFLVGNGEGNTDQPKGEEVGSDQPNSADTQGEKATDGREKGNGDITPSDGANGGVTRAPAEDKNIESQNKQNVTDNDTVFIYLNIITFVKLMSKKETLKPCYLKILMQNFL